MNVSSSIERPSRVVDGVETSFVEAATPLSAVASFEGPVPSERPFDASFSRRWIDVMTNLQGERSPSEHFRTSTEGEENHE